MSNVTLLAIGGILFFIGIALLVISFATTSGTIYSTERSLFIISTMIFGSLFVIIGPVMFLIALVKIKKSHT